MDCQLQLLKGNTSIYARCDIQHALCNLILFYNSQSCKFAFCTMPFCRKSK
ncbi:hypothetical protein OIU79_008214 [Salix purpurea]|uniref:Uncharacterized protein n=1 Tax=Salix purpurea TaxID=77065 RepID=A0A9Q0THW8_SALPP|nr:hypothetical protein OIU79_008214 [Salix purpurea]